MWRNYKWARQRIAWKMLVRRIILIPLACHSLHCGVIDFEAFFSVLLFCDERFKLLFVVRECFVFLRIIAELLRGVKKANRG